MGHACSQVAWMQFVSRARTQADPAATVTRSAIQGLSKEESRELDVARRGLGSQRGAGWSVALSQIEYIQYGLMGWASVGRRTRCA